MNISRNWLRALVDTDLSGSQLRALITDRCAAVDEVIPLRADLEPIVIARVVSADKHPDSDHLSVTKVDAGTGELLDVVCGAPNVSAGKLYPFAKTGTVMPGGLRIERRRIRGAVSNGMLCSARELGLGDDHEGILELDVDAAPGTPFLRAMPVGDVRIVVDVTPNRPDLLSHLGIAREVAAATGTELRLPEFPGAPVARLPEPHRAGHEGKTGRITVRLDDAEGSPRYMGVTISGVTVGSSPAWLSERIQAVGGRSINNVVDATNYILHELGQPIHAFDVRKLAGSTVIVRRARPGEKLRTLDGTDRALDESMTVIADGERAQAIAGVMGGFDSEVTEATKDIFLEVAYFDPASVRATRRKLGMSTDASYRFERGVDPEITASALERAVQLIVAVAGGRVDDTAVDLRPTPFVARTIALRPARVARLLGESFSPDAIHALLASVGFEIVGTPMALQSADAMFILVPSWRPDVTVEVDLIEEVARLHGYDRFSSEVRPYRPGTVPESPLAITARRVRDDLVSAGLLETRPLPFVAGRDETHARVLNPLAENEPHLRTDLLSTLARRAEFNLAHMQRSIRLFEIGDVFIPAHASLPREEMHVAALIMGDRRPVHFTEPRPPAIDEWDARGLAERIAALVYPASEVVLDVAADADVRAADADVPAADADVLAAHVDVLWTVKADGMPVGVVRELSLDAPVWAARAFGVEVLIATIDARPIPEQLEDARQQAHVSAARTVRYRAIPTTPAVEIDLALVVPDHVPAAQVESVLRESAGAQLERLQLFDQFRGGDLPDGHRSLAWRLTFRHPERTLGSKEIDGRRDRILRTLDKTLGIRQRSA